MHCTIILTFFLAWILSGCGSADVGCGLDAPCPWQAVAPVDAPTGNPDPVDSMPAPDAPMDAGTPSRTDAPAPSRTDAPAPETDAGTAVQPFFAPDGGALYMNPTLPALTNVQVQLDATHFAIRSFAEGNPYSCNAAPTGGTQDPNSGYDCYCRPGFVPKLFLGETIANCVTCTDIAACYSAEFISPVLL